MKRTLRFGIGFLVILVLAMIAGFQPLYYLLYVAVGGTALGYLWVWLQSKGLESHVQEVSLHPQVGQSVLLRVTVRERLGLPRGGLRARLVGDFTTMDEDDFRLSPWSTTTWTVTGLCQYRGLNTIGSLALISSDPSGLFSLEAHVGEPESILIYPATVPLSRAVAEGQASGGELGEAGPLAGHSPTVSMIRQYVSGDSMAHIHWPSTARMDQLMTKEFEGAGINEIWVFADLEEEAQAGEGNESTEEYTVTIAASLAKGLIDNGHAVGLAAQGDQYYQYAPRRDLNHLWALMRALALVKARGKTPMMSLVEQESASLGPGTIAIVVGPWPRQNATSLYQFLGRRGVLVVPILLDPVSFGRPPEPRWQPDPRSQIQDLVFVVKQGDDLSRSLGTVLDMISTY